jgi:hypothetical protein
MIAELLVLAAVPAILGPLLSAAVKKLLSERKQRDIEIEFKSGERLHLKVDANATEEQIRKLVIRNEEVRHKAAESSSGA